MPKEKLYKPVGAAAIKKIPTVDLLYHLRQRLVSEKPGEDELLDISLALNVIAMLASRLRQEQYESR